MTLGIPSRFRSWGLLALALSLPSCYAGGTHWRFLSRQPKETMDLPDTLGVPQLRQQLAARSAKQNVVEVWTAVDWNERLRLEGKGIGPAGVPVRDRYKVAPGDRISVQVAGEPTLSKDYYVRPDGAFSFPWVGEIPVEGMSVPEVERTVREGLLVYMKDPQVTVNLEQGTQRITSGGITAPDFGNIMIFGELGAGSAGTGITGRVLPFSGRESLLNVISMAGGLGARANWRNVAIFRREPDAEVEGAFKTLVIVSDMSNFFKQADFEQNIPLKINDIVFVPTQPEYIGVAFKHDWDLVLGYLGGISSYDQFIRRLSDTGKILPRSEPNTEGNNP